MTRAADHRRQRRSRRNGRGLLSLVLCTLLAAAPALAGAQIIPGTGGASQEQGADKDWSAPDIMALPQDWWTRFGFDSKDSQRERLGRFVERIRERAEGLEGMDQERADAALANLVSLVELLEITGQGPVEETFEPVPTQDAYTIEDLFRIRRLVRNLERQETRVNLEIEQNRRQLQLLQDRRDRLRRQYAAQEPESPAHILTGIERVSARVEYALSRTRADNLEQRLGEIGKRRDVLEEQQDYAIGHLVPGDTTVEGAAAEVATAREALARSGERVTALQAQLLEALSSDPVNESLELLRKQQLTRATAAQELAALELRRAEAVANWHLFRADALEPAFDFRAANSEARELTAQALRQVDVWSAATQVTLASSAPGDSPNARANHELALAAARETLELIDEIRAVSDELLLVEETLASELVASQSGIRKAWSSLELSAGGLWDNLQAFAEYDLFSIGETPVTPGGIVVMLLIVALAWVISWVTRYLIRHASTSGDQFSQSPVAYTLGRILHYVIMTVGLFAAFTSIGFDFTSFALIAGALSVGIGFGLQAVVNNFVSGLILLLEGSLRVGDYIELDQSLAGVVKEINTRATVVNTNDNVDVVVPNSELVTTRLTNWTLRESIARMRVPFGVAYGSDKEQVKAAALAAAKDVEFVLTNMPGRQPQVRLYNFGDSALEFDMLLWVSRAGVRRPHRIRCDFLWHLETRLAEAGIEIPFPQRDIHLRSDFRHPAGAAETRPTGLEAVEGHGNAPAAGPETAQD